MPDRPSRPQRPRRRTPRATRPSARRASAGGSGAATRTSAPRPRGRFTGRAVVLVVVLLALALSYVFPMRVYLAQQAEIAQLRADQAEQRRHIDELAEEAALWRDPDYVRTQARQRLYYGEPGEILLIPQWSNESEQPVSEADPADQPAPAPPWWQTLWASVQSADGGRTG
jgi:cell division protein FtsB